MTKSMAAICALLALAAPAHAAERKLLIANFENIIVTGDIDVSVQTGKSPSAIATGDKRILEALKLERVGMTLRVRLQDIVNNERGIPVSAPLKVVLTTRAVQDMTVNGNGRLSVSDVRQQSASRALITGNGAISVGRLTADQFTASITGNGKVDIGGGGVRDARVTIDGAGAFDGAKLQMRKLRLEHIGNAVSSATVAEDAEIHNRGSGNITIGGKGTCFIKLAGNANIDCPKVDKRG